MARDLSMREESAPLITFYMQVYDDQQNAVVALAQLRRAYPDARIIVRSDGGGRHISDCFGVEFYDEQRVFTPEHGGLAVHRMLELWNLSPTKYLFKIDPDTCVLRSLSNIPMRDGVFGTIQFFGKAKSVQGGCIGITRAAAQELLTSGMLVDGRLASITNIPPRFAKVLRMRIKKWGLASFDWSIGWACHELKIPVYAHGEIHSRWRNCCSTYSPDYAIIHPWDWHNPQWQITPEHIDVRIGAFMVERLLPE